MRVSSQPGPLIVGIVLAGGLARRLGGGDKGFVQIGGRALIERILERLGPQCGPLIVNANGDPARLSRLGLPVVADGVPGHAGPLAGVLAGLDWIADHAPATRFAVTVPSDTPFLPCDLVRRLDIRASADRAAIACARSGGRTHYPVGLWDVTLRHEIRDALVGDGLRRMGDFLQPREVTYVEWSAEPFDPFLNVNTPADVAAADNVARRFSL